MSLTVLHFNRNSVSDISSLSGLTRLTDLNLTYNSISDISVLNEFTELAGLRLYNNPIMDISTLRGLTRLTNLHVHDLPDLSDIQPLLNNSGLGAGDRVILFNSDISCEDAATLQTKGVSVGSGYLRVILMQEWRSILAALAVCAGLVAAVVVAWRRYRSP